MCGVAGLFGPSWNAEQLQAMVAHQRHRGPDGQGVHHDEANCAGLGHNRLSIIDLSDAGAQPMFSYDGRLAISFNGEIYNYLELRAELSSAYEFRSKSDTEVILAAYERWGEGCLDHFVGMFALMIWDKNERKLFAARDRFGVKPLYFHRRSNGDLALASELRAFRAIGLATEPDPIAWSTYLSTGVHEYSPRTFWLGVESLPPGHKLTWQNGKTMISGWYDIAEASGNDYDERPDSEVESEYLALLEESVRLRFRSDVPVGINLSGGVDSSILLGMVHAIERAESEVSVFTFVTGDSRYDELPWVRQMLARTKHPLVTCKLTAEMVPELAKSVQAHEDEPFGGIPTLAYARIFEEARARGVYVLLDGQGMDEQWAGYDYYRYGNGASGGALVQGTSTSPVRPDCLKSDFAALAEPFEAPNKFPDVLRNRQYRDARYTKIPRALRFNDRVSMRSSTELREPFLDHRLFELALRQPPRRKIQCDTGKWMLRRLALRLAPGDLLESPKRPVQTPQREWLRGPLADWADQRIDDAVGVAGGDWLDAKKVRKNWTAFRKGEGDNSVFVWQWINLALAAATWD
ncbi:MAG: asparagine synthase (glutamine-hydrolyzing) [Gemmatimonadaceae bacterium]